MKSTKTVTVNENLIYFLLGFLKAKLSEADYITVTDILWSNEVKPNKQEVEEYKNAYSRL